jgi:hypothetical protein
MRDPYAGRVYPVTCIVYMRHGVCGSLNGRAVARTPTDRETTPTASK